jgi:hypothetical protein
MTDPMTFLVIHPPNDSMEMTEKVYLVQNTLFFSGYTVLLIKHEFCQPKFAVSHGAEL